MAVTALQGQGAGQLKQAQVTGGLVAVAHQFWGTSFGRALGCQPKGRSVWPESGLSGSDEAGAYHLLDISAYTWLGIL